MRNHKVSGSLSTIQAKIAKFVENMLVCRMSSHSLKSEYIKVLWKFYCQSISGEKSRKGRRKKANFRAITKKLPVLRT